MRDTRRSCPTCCIILPVILSFLDKIKLRYPHNVVQIETEYLMLQLYHSATRQAEQETVARAKAKHASSRTFVEGKEEIKHLYDVGRSLQNEFNPYRKHDSFYDFQKVILCIPCVHYTSKRIAKGEKNSPSTGKHRSFQARLAAARPNPEGNNCARIAFVSSRRHRGFVYEGGSCCSKGMQ